MVARRPVYIYAGPRMGPQSIYTQSDTHSCATTHVHAHAHGGTCERNVQPWQRNKRDTNMNTNTTHTTEIMEQWVDARTHTDTYSRGPWLVNSPRHICTKRRAQDNIGDHIRRTHDRNKTRAYTLSLSTNTMSVRPHDEQWRSWGIYVHIQTHTAWSQATAQIYVHQMVGPTVYLGSVSAVHTPRNITPI
jgi:hypothetical protein